ncbi:MAG: hypothetical protein JO270_22435 [Acidobacteriaceae bacterium]|nr:hypothetical protein [Acidobacteriaceae bacterium]MBV8573253.1 hypothetical protein [Acidobacteriaceae bacterium]
MPEQRGDLYLGIDGGQSATTALIANENGRVVGHGQGGPCNHITGPEAREKFLRAVGGCIEQACRNADVNASAVCFASACCGFSGGAEDKERYARELIRSRRWKITHDAEIALTGATKGEPGIVVIAGTGSMAFGRNRQGETARAGGWGYIFGDEGGAFDLVRRAIRAALQFEEGWGSETQLHARLLAATQERTADTLLHRFYGMPRAEIARYAPIVTEAAEAHDAIAEELLERSAAALAWYVQGVRGQLFPPDEYVRVAYAGGVFDNVTLRCHFIRQVTASGCDPIQPRLSPVAGALLEAFRIDDKHVELSNVPESEKGQFGAAVNHGSSDQRVL